MLWYMIRCSHVVRYHRIVLFVCVFLNSHVPYDIHMCLRLSASLSLSLSLSASVQNRTLT